MKVTIVSFDVEGTLISCKFSQIVWEEAIPKLYAEKLGIGLDEAKSHVMEEYAKIGEERVEWYDIKYWFNRFGLSDYENLLMTYKHEITLYPEVTGVLDELSKNYKLIVSSNSSREFLTFEIEKIEKYFFKVFSASSDLKQLKTAAFYGRICEILGVNPKSVVHVGDRWVDDFVAPRKAGIVAYYLDRERARSGDFVIKNLQELKAQIENLEQA